MITLHAQIAEAKRELALRKRVYPRWVKDQRMSATEAQYQLEAMAAILETLTSLETTAEQMELLPGP